MTLREYLADNYARNVLDHAARASVSEDGRVSFYIHPANVSGTTLDFEVTGEIGGFVDILIPDPRISVPGGS